MKISNCDLHADKEICERRYLYLSLKPEPQLTNMARSEPEGGGGGGGGGGGESGTEGRESSLTRLPVEGC